ncbi:MAG: peptidylprolyl isomerase [Clostridia bacterium]|nr:peptidylprolyl isomerase [Clostridia bacterium]
MNKLLKIICLILAVCSVSIFFASCDNESVSDKAYYDYENSNTGSGTGIRTKFVEREIDSMKVEDFVTSDKESDYVLIKVKDYGEIVVLLRADVAPVTVANFKKLVKENFHAGTIFHRIIKDFMIQGGGMVPTPDEDGKGITYDTKDADEIFGEFDSNGFTNNLYHVRGVISMARTDVKNSASCQFFIVHEDSAHLNGDYASFGYVLAGMDVVDAIANCKEFIEPNSTMPMDDIIIESITFVEPK